MIKITKDLVGRWIVYYGASGFAAFYGKIIEVNEEKEYFIFINGISKSRGGCGKYHVSLFDTEKEAKKEYEDYQFVEG